ncbi:FAD-dependent urate hydroxylase HpxO [Salinicola endophyticus]|uniref:FAD-dependent urate hydroxylase n=1 Tax=Salinicola endophyticus TaxID=1949083 RepID=A0ABY8FHA1_9GAMM|nr:FAD-dependent urate hydroxylase HpxO [Salinicola endophyticus]WFF40551.1 FAD-dependent urate hydroxylase HpxO [Salinicola endophyticus]
MSLNVLVIGAGMGGLTAALALKHRGHQVAVVDRVAELRPVGAAISVWSNGVKILKALGVGEALEHVSGDMQRMSYYTRDGAQLTDFSLAPLYAEVGQRACPVARAALQQLLLDAVGAEAVTLGTACTDYRQDASGITAHFDDGSERHADLLVIADGTHSRLREQALGRPVPRRYCGYVNWNVRVPASEDLAPLHDWVQYVGDHQRVSLMPMSGDPAHPEFYCFFDVPLAAGSDNDPARYREELAHHFAGWASPVQRLIARFDPAAMARVEIHDIAPLETLVAPRVAILGDAAHGMAPDLGQGGCQAMEDAWVLAESLEASGHAIAEALAHYDAARVARVGDIVSRARKRAETTHGADPAATRAWYSELAAEDGRHIMGGMSKTILGGPLG